jgi:hypothetical protein
VPSDAYTDCGVRKAYVYRSTVGSDGTAMYGFVGEFPITNGTTVYSFTDSRKAEDVEEAAVSSEWDEPLEMSGILSLSNGVFVGFNGYDNYGVSILNSYTLLDFKQIGYTNSACYSIYNLVSEFNSPINIAEIMRANCSSEASEYWDFNRTWTWKGTANGKTVTAICPKLKWEK